MRNFKILVFSLIIGISLAATTTFALGVWQGTDWITIGEVISAENIKENFDYLYEHSLGGGLTPPVCTGSDKVLQWNGDDWDCATIGAEESVTFIGGAHATEDCTALGGNVQNTPDGYICALSGSSCPSGWAKHNNWSTTVARGCNIGGSSTYAGGYACASECTTSSHSFSNIATETCAYTTGNPVNFSCAYKQNHTCVATVIEVGCK